MEPGGVYSSSMAVLLLQFNYWTTLLTTFLFISTVLTALIDFLVVAIFLSGYELQQ